MEPLSNIDVVILIGIAISMIVAFIRGFVKEVLSIVGLGLFVFISVNFSADLTTWLKQFIQSDMMAKFVAFLVIMALFYAIWIIGTDKVISRIRTSTLSFMDRLFGLIFGFFRATIILGFCFLLVKVMLPELLKDDVVKKSTCYTLAKTSSDFIEELLPEETIKKAFSSVEEMNKVSHDKKSEKKNKEVKEDKKIDNKVKDLPSKLEQEQMNKMFELLVKPEIKKKSKSNEVEQKGYDKSETSGLDKLIDEASN
ncbi:MAG: CvpA family protein [Alphaproteobacteria bacterium]|nr:CvpA family protein [Alphaproteobacteria bacterium]